MSIFDIKIDLLEPLTPLEKLAAAKVAIKARCSKSKEEEKETKAMYTPEQVKTQYLQSESYTIRDRKIADLRETFHLNELEPKDDEEKVQFIKDGKYVLEERTNPYHGQKFKKLVWRDSANPPNKEGFDAAMKLVDTDFRQLSREIVIKDPNIALDALVAFEQKTYH